AGGDDLAQAERLGVEVEALQQVLDGLGAHAAGEILAEALLELPVEHLVTDELTHLELAEGVHDLVEAVDLPLGLVADLAHLAFAAVLDLAADVGAGAFGFELGHVGFEFGGAVLDRGVALLLERALLGDDLVLQRRDVPLTGLVVDAGDDVGGEVDDLLKVLRRQVQEVSQSRGHTLEVPDVRDRGGQLDVAHPLAADLRAGHLDTTALTDDALEADAL